MKAIIKTQDLKRLVKATAKFISEDDRKRMLSWIKLSFNKETSTAKAVAIDGYRVSVENANYISVDENFTAYIKPYLPVKVKAEYATIELIDGKCFIDIDGSISGYVQPEDKYLDDNKIVADIEAVKVTSEVMLSREFLIDALNSLQQKDAYSRIPVVIQIRENHQAVSIKLGESTRYILPVRN